MSAKHATPSELFAGCSALVRRAALLLAGAAIFTLALGNPLSAQQPTAKKTVQVVEKFLLTEDGWQIAITYRNSLLGQNAPVVVLLPRLGNDRIVWEGKGGLAERLSSEGFAVISVDLRKQGQSKGPDDGTAGVRRDSAATLRPEDYERMVDNDLEAVKEFIFREHQAKNLNMNKTAIVAAESSAPIAILFTVRDWLKRPYPDGPTLESSTPRGQDIRALALLSPEANLRGATTNDALQLLRNPDWGIYTWTFYGTEDSEGEKDADRIFTKLTGLSASRRARMSKEEAEKYKDGPHFIQGYPYKLRGTDLLRKELNCEEDVVFFLNKYFKDIPGEWRDRRNRLTAN